MTTTSTSNLKNANLNSAALNSAALKAFFTDNYEKAQNRLNELTDKARAPFVTPAELAELAEKVSGLIARVEALEARSATDSTALKAIKKDIAQLKKPATRKAPAKKTAAPTSK